VHFNCLQIILPDPEGKRLLEDFDEIWQVGRGRPVRPRSLRCVATDKNIQLGTVHTYKSPIELSSEYAEFPSVIRLRWYAHKSFIFDFRYRAWF